MRYDDLSDEVLLCLCVYREARGEADLGKRGVAHTVLNRVKADKFFGHDIRSVILKPWQFSSFNANDPNADLWPPGQNNTAWAECTEIVAKVLSGQDADITNGAVYYHDVSLNQPPAVWGSVELTLETGRLKFYRPAPAEFPAMEDV